MLKALQFENSCLWCWLYSAWNFSGRQWWKLAFLYRNWMCLFFGSHSPYTKKVFVWIIAKTCRIKGQQGWTNVISKYLPQAARYGFILWTLKNKGISLPFAICIWIVLPYLIEQYLDSCTHPSTQLYMRVLECMVMCVDGCGVHG